jgi:hypothetical protein
LHRKSPDAWCLDREPAVQAQRRESQLTGTVELAPNGLKALLGWDRNLDSIER